MALPIYTGPIARALGGVDISMLFGLSASGLLYFFLARKLDLTAERRAQQYSQAVLEPSAQAEAESSTDGRIRELSKAVATR